MILLFSIGFLLACNNQSTGDNKKPDGSGEVDAQQHETAGENLELNNGQKWKSDSATSANVRNIRDIVGGFYSGQDRSLTAHQIAASALQEALNKMIADCKMTGPAHDALHRWLEPLLEKVKAIRKSTAESEVAGLMNEIKDQVNLYQRYFE
jgi:hypothetical protein